MPISTETKIQAVGGDTGGEDSDEEQKILSWFRSRYPGHNEIFYRDIRKTYAAKTVAELLAEFERRKLAAAEYREEQKRREFELKKNRMREIIQSAKVPKIFADVRSKDFKITANNADAAAVAIQSIRENIGLYIYGDCGTGKTMLSSLIVNERAELFKQSLFIGAVDVFHELNPYSSDSRNAAMKKGLVKFAPCLVIDDLGAEKPSDWTRQTLFEIIDYRYRENLQTIITSNFDVEGLKSRLGSPPFDYEGNRIIRRIKDICRLVELKHY